MWYDCSVDWIVGVVGGGGYVWLFCVVWYFG